jgi:hypothetical protein
MSPPLESFWARGIQSPRPHFIFLSSILILPHCLDADSVVKGRVWVFSVSLLFLISFIRATCPDNLIVLDLVTLIIFWPITVAARSKAWTVFARSNAGIVGSNPAQVINVCIVCVYFVFFVVLCVGRGLAKGWSPVQGVLPTVYGFTKLKKGPRPNKGL